MSFKNPLHALGKIRDLYLRRNHYACKNRFFLVHETVLCKPGEHVSFLFLLLRKKISGDFLQRKLLIQMFPLQLPKLGV